MKALKKATFGTFMILSFFMIALGGYNSAIVDKSAYSKNDFGIKLAKRLDEFKGEITIGRMAASIPNWSKKSTRLIKKEVKQILKKKVAVKKTVKKVEETTAIPAPVVNDDLELSLTGGFYNKKALDSETEFSGVATVQDGVIEEISVSLPDGASLSINTNERMVGNVFQYEDTGTRERKSGLFYKVKPGVFMLTLTDDTKFPGLRLEFKTNETVQLADSLEANEQDLEHAQVDEKLIEKDYYQESAAEEVKPQEASKETITYGFNFNS